MKQATLILVKVTSCNTLSLMLLVWINIYLKSVL